MQCRKVEEMLKLDYADGRLNPKQTKYIKEHLAVCQKCAQLEAELKIQRKLLQGTERKEVPESLWFNIRDAIIHERVNQESRVIRFAWHPAPVLISVFTVIILASLLTGTFIRFNRVNLAEDFQGYSLNGDSGVFLYDLGTNIEEYFL
ncbi:MAG: zf-HC2 domain-containing protein [Candidatus Omnitrophica bacterium]|nr:zf-HC2 domain-containing protein [Candidatus Omnitrophota bacterium]